MANERTYIKDQSGKTIAHIDTIGDGLYYKVIIPMISSPIMGFVGGFVIMGLLFIVIRPLRRQDGFEPRGGRSPLAHEARGDDRRLQRSGFGKRANDEGLGDTDAKLAGEKLEQDEALQPIQLPKPGRRTSLLRCRIESSKSQHALFQPLAQ